MSRVRVAAVISAALAIIASVSPSPYSVIAKDEPAAKAGDGSRRVPPHFAKLDLTGEQKNRIYTIQEQYEGKIDALLAEVEQLKVQRDSEVESVLSAGQRAELKKFLDEAKVDRVQRSKETEAAKKAYEALKKKQEKAEKK
jgi:Spy/CpxP family protein refolding chaperone